MRNTKNPEKVSKKITVTKFGDRSVWPKIVEGMHLSARIQTMSIDEGDGQEEEVIEVKYLLKNVHNRKKVFEVSVKCDPDRLNEEIHSFSVSAR